MKIYILEPCSSVIKGLEPMFNAEGVYFTQSKTDADAIISSSLPELKKSDLNPNAKKIFWTNEARWSSSTDGFIENSGQKIHIMNCYTGNVFMDIFHYAWTCKYKKISQLTKEEYKKRKELSPRPAYFMASNHGDGTPFFINGKNIDLYQYRDNLALYGFNKGLTDIYGQGWPAGVAIEESRVGNSWDSWESRKLKIADQYFFTLCIENTNFKYLVTEKWWHSIISKTMPIYYIGDTCIEEYFSSDLFFDAGSYNEFDALYDQIACIKEETYIEKVNCLIQKFNELIPNPENLAISRKAMCLKVIEVLNL